MIFYEQIIIGEVEVEVLDTLLVEVIEVFDEVEVEQF